MTPMRRLVLQAQTLIDRAKAAPLEAERIELTRELWRLLAADDKPARAKPIPREYQ